MEDTDLGAQIPEVVTFWKFYMSKGNNQHWWIYGVQILLFQHTKFLKCNRFGSSRLLRGPRPPYGKSWIRH